MFNDENDGASRVVGGIVGDMMPVALGENNARDGKNDAANDGVSKSVRKSKTGRGLAGTEIIRNPNGTFAPGTPAPGHGPPKAITNKDYIDAIKAEFPPEEITRLLREAIAIAVSTKSWRGVVAALEFSANYSLGKPKQQVEAAAGAGLAALMAGVDGSAPLLPEEGKGAEDTNAGAIGTDNLELSEVIPPGDEGG